MLYNLIQSILRKSGKHYTVDARIPNRLLFAILCQRLICLLRGYIRTGKHVFIDAHVTFQGGKGKLALGSGATLEDHVVINAHVIEDFTIGQHAKIGAYSHIMGTTHLSRMGRAFRLGDYAACGEFCYFGCAGGITIGKRTITGQYVSMHAQEHEFDTTDKSIMEQGTTEKGITIGDDCWIGAKATILDGTIIGNHCVVAAGAVVKGQFPDYTVIAGVPAKIIRSLKEDMHHAA